MAAGRSGADLAATGSSPERLESVQVLRGIAAMLVVFNHANSLTFIPIFDDDAYSWPLHFLGWTLAFEWVFYLLVALLISMGRRA